MSTHEEKITPLQRAQDILLGSLGFGGEAVIITMKVEGDVYSGTAKWPDGEEFEFKSEDELDDLQKWAIEIFLQNK